MQGGELHFALRAAAPLSNAATDDAAAQPYSLTRGEAVSIPYTTQNGEPLHRAARRRAGDDDLRSGNPLYARRLGTRLDTSALYAGRRCRWTVR